MAASYDFDGTSDWIDYGDNSIDNGLTALTASLWVKASQAATFYAFQHFDSSSNGGFYFALSSSGGGTMVTRVYDTDGNSWRLASDDAISISEWTHISYRWRGNGASACDMDQFVNATEIASTPTIANNAMANLGDAPRGQSMQIGAWKGGNRMDGNITDVALYNRYLSNEEIKEIMEIPTSIVNGLIFYTSGRDGNWKNEVGDGLTGTVNGAPAASSDGPPVYFPSQKA